MSSRKQKSALTLGQAETGNRCEFCILHFIKCLTSKKWWWNFFPGSSVWLLVFRLPKDRSFYSFEHISEGELTDGTQDLHKSHVSWSSPHDLKIYQTVQHRWITQITKFICSWHGFLCELQAAVDEGNVFNTVNGKGNSTHPTALAHLNCSPGFLLRWFYGFLESFENVLNHS